MTNYGPIVRIILRYVVGACLLGSQEIGDQLAADPDLIMMGGLAVGALVEAFYARAKIKGGKT